MKKRSILILALCVGMIGLSGCGAADEPTTGEMTQNSTVEEADFTDAADLVRDIPTVQKFTQEAVAEDDIQLIVEAGAQSPSALNQQPWHFAVITDQEVLQTISGDMGGGMPGAGDIPEGAEMPSFDEENPPEGMCYFKDTFQTF